MRIAVLTFGTRGDLQPPLAIADGLRSRGHDVVVAANTNNVEPSRRVGFETVELPVDLLKFLSSGAAQQSLVAGNTVRFTRALAKLEAEHAEALDEAHIRACDGADLIVTGPLSLGRALAITGRSGQQLAMHLPFPIDRTAEYASPFVTGRHLPTGALRLATHLVFEQAYAATGRATAQRMRRRLGATRPAPDLWKLVRANAFPIELLVSPALFGRPGDWPDRTISGMAVVPPGLRAAWGEQALDPELEQWLDEGEPPVFVSFGGMPVLDPAGCLAMIEEVARRHGVRMLLGAGWSTFEAGPRAGRTVLVTGSFDHSRVLPRCRAAVHHGGSGTTHAVARAGIPAVVAHLSADQILWGQRVVRTGTGTALPYRTLSADTLSSALAVALRPETGERATELAAAMATEDGVAHFCDTVTGVRPAATRGR
ncbi:glycosyltransferase [Nocardia stercoris]|uniref:Glycosyltransferase n=1 Tax=Nocardia stercoris TaxID=2483361 RepID=A0A3M2L7U3_9NOCA|nr:glycosyltransferase [Nocardia stercoris]RMI33424.1 glycosyltransferase [Nocardia stercoris]